MANLHACAKLRNNANKRILRRFCFKGESGGSGQDTSSQCSTRIEEEDAELGIMEDDPMNSAVQAVSIAVYTLYIGTFCSVCLFFSIFIQH